jgi:ATP-dependent DNA helicase RecG
MGKRNKGLGGPVDDLKGVGPKVSAALRGRGIRTVEDIIFFLPLRYEDRREVREIAAVKEGEQALVAATVIGAGSLFFRNARKRGYELIVEDGTGTMSLKWFHRVPASLREAYARGAMLLASGKVSRFGDRFQILHPDVILLKSEDETDSHKVIVPVYPEIEGIKQGTLRKLMKQVFKDYGDDVQSLIPEEVERAYDVLPYREACLGVHFPAGGDSPAITGDSCRDRLVLEEFFAFQMAVTARKDEMAGGRGLSFKTEPLLMKRVIGGLPFGLTPAQERVMGEIKRDMGGERPMNRLLQGDVGCGKTILAVLASCIAVANGCQAAFMAPTEILAEQHYLTVHRIFENLDIPLVYLRGDMGKERRGALEHVESGKASVVIGTHALMRKDVVFRKLGLVVVDEQHRFGVLQRQTLREKGAMPHVLVMSATPIPRTLSMVLHGDLDVSVIDAMPEGRRRIETILFPDSHRAEVYQLIEDELSKGHQAYVVYPLIDESEKLDLPGAGALASDLKPVFPGRRIELLHGRMKAEEKEHIMSLFKAKEIDVLVCTTVIEVGIDVPNATLMAVCHAERFGLSQLHQLRGRVGRSSLPSKCLLLTAPERTEQATRRLRAMEKHHDGFVIAEEDLKIRGPGEMLGVRQSGLPGFRTGDLRRDGEIMTLARRIAVEARDTWERNDFARVRDLVLDRRSGYLSLIDVA